VSVKGNHQAVPASTETIATTVSSASSLAMARLRTEDSSSYRRLDVSRCAGCDALVAMRWSRPLDSTPKSVAIAREAIGRYVSSYCAYQPVQLLLSTKHETDGPRRRGVRHA